MNRVGQFEKVSFNQFKEDYLRVLLSNIDYDDLTKAEEDALIQAYDTITIPVRATTGSAGYDFVSPIDFKLYPGESITLPTVLSSWNRYLNPSPLLGKAPRNHPSSIFTLIPVGIIDSDYYFSDNQGHIMAKITNDNKEEKALFVGKGKKFIQGIFLPFGITYDDEADGVRNGGFGSTGA